MFFTCPLVRDFFISFLPFYQYSEIIQGKFYIFNFEKFKVKHGATRYRSLYLSHAKRSLYHLSYSPMLAMKSYLITKLNLYKMNM